MFVVIFICRNLFFRIAGKTAKIRTRKNVVPHGINKNEPCIVKGWQYTPKCEFPVTCSVSMRPGAQKATFRLVEMRDFKYLLCEWDKHSSLLWYEMSYIGTAEWRKKCKQEHFLSLGSSMPVTTWGRCRFMNMSNKSLFLHIDENIVNLSFSRLQNPSRFFLKIGFARRETLAWEFGAKGVGGPRHTLLPLTLSPELNRLGRIKVIRPALELSFYVRVRVFNLRKHIKDWLYSKAPLISKIFSIVLRVFNLVPRSPTVFSVKQSEIWVRD